MTIVEAAESLGIAASTLRRQVTKGVVQATKHGRDWWVDPEEVERYRRFNLGRIGRPRKAKPNNDALLRVRERLVKERDQADSSFAAAGLIKAIEIIDAELAAAVPGS